MHNMNKTLPKTGIPWADRQWPILRGCSPASAGCQHTDPATGRVIRCYAGEWFRRFEKHMNLPPWGKPHFLPENIDMPMRTKTPCRVFVAPMSDIGHEGVAPFWRFAIAQAMHAAPWHTYIILTKRPGPWLRELPPACWVGATIEHQHEMLRWNTLLGWCWPGAPVQFVSVEPMLGPVTFSLFPDWVIAGPETGPKARPCDPEWIEALSRESPCFFDKRAGDGRRREWPTKQRKERT